MKTPKGLNVKVHPEAVKYIRYRKSGKNLILEDVEQQLGHMYVRVDARDLQALGLDRDALIKWLEDHGAKKAPPQARRKKPFSIYD